MKHGIRTLIVSGLICFLITVILFNPAAADDPPDIGTSEGEMYPDFYLPRLDGTYERLSDYRGKKVILFQFASW